MNSNRLLCVVALAVRYGKRPILNGVNLNVEKGEIVSLIGHNGAGKTTLLKALFGLIQISEGIVQLDGYSYSAFTVRNLLRSGVTYLPQGNHVFANLTVRENLEIGNAIFLHKYAIRTALERVLAYFPSLERRLHQNAGTLSGGEQQLLAFASALMLSPRLILLDEPSIGLSPMLVSEVFSMIQSISCDSGTAVLMVEQKVRDVLRIANRVYVMRNGSITFSGRSQELKDEKTLHSVYF